MVNAKLVRTTTAGIALAMIGSWSPETSGTDKIGVLRAGAAAVDISPVHFPVNMIGLFNENMAGSVHDPLHARALVFDDGTTTLAIVEVDSLGVPRHIGDRIRTIASERCGIAPDRMLIASTHAHSAPSSGQGKAPDETVAYRDILVNGAAEAIVRAYSALRPAEVGCAVQPLPDEVFNRRWFLKPGKMELNPFGQTDQVRMNPPNSPEYLLRPAGPTDPDITVLSVQDAASHRPLALLANYALHYVGHIPKGQISADYFGEFARLMPSRLGADETFVAIMSNGASGDVNNVPYGASRPRPPREPFEQVQIVAREAVDVAIRAYERIGEHRTDVRIGSVRREVTLRWRHPTPEQIAYAETVLATTDETARAKLPRLAEIYARRTLAAARKDASVEAPLQVIRIGDLCICAIPFEAFAEIGLELKRRSPFPHTMIIEIANHSLGYLPTPEQHKLGGYETWLGTCQVQEDASVIITDQLLQMLAELNEETGKGL